MGGVRPSLWTAARRPLFLTLVLASVVSLLATSVATMRLVVPTAVYWSFVPVVEVVALLVVIWRRRNARGLPALIDAFFVGHAAWTVFILAVGVVMAVAPAGLWWFLIVRPGIAGVVLVVGWSLYVDVCFFRYLCGAPLARAVGDVALNRLITWTLIFWIFAVPDPTPLGVIQEIVEAVKEVLR